MGRCPERTRWSNERCVPCSFTVKPGTEITPNCGYDDEGSRHEGPTKACRDKTFNDGSWDYCRPCSPCPPGRPVWRACEKTADSLCDPPSNEATTVTVTTYQWLNFTSASPPVLNMAHPAAVWAAPVAVLASIILAMAVYIFTMKRKRGQMKAVGYQSRTSFTNPRFSKVGVEDIVNLNILSAPIQTVLDNLDVLEELVILLDPESPGIKNTKHLASLCSFSSSWITYTYSMKDSKSPLKAVLEGVTCREPDWTVRDLAKLLRQIERNDAIAALTKLRVEEMDV